MRPSVSANEVRVTGPWRFRGLAAAGSLLLALLFGLAMWMQMPDRPAAEKTAAHGDGKHRVRERSSLLSTLEDIHRETDPMRREERLSAFMKELDPARLPTLLEELLRIPPDGSERELFARLVRRWAEDDPAAASAWVATLAEGGLRSAALEQVALARTEQDPHDAAEWARSLEDGDEREAAMLAVGNDAVRTDPFAAISLAAKLPPSRAGDDLLRRATMEWASTDAPAAAEWARTVEDEALRAHLFAGVALASGEANPVTAATLASEEPPPGRPRADAVVGVVQRWAARDPAATAAWVASFPDGTLRRDATTCLMERWSRSAPDEAARWHAEHSNPTE